MARQNALYRFRSNSALDSKGKVRREFMKRLPKNRPLWEPDRTPGATAQRRQSGRISQPME